MRLFGLEGFRARRVARRFRVALSHVARAPPTSLPRSATILSPALMSCPRVGRRSRRLDVEHGGFCVERPGHVGGMQRLGCRHWK